MATDQFAYITVIKCSCGVSLVSSAFRKQAEGYLHADGKMIPTIRNFFNPVAGEGKDL